MKLTFSTLGAPELSFPQILALAGEYGMDAIELRGILGDVTIDTLPILRSENRPETAKTLAACGISICVLGCSAAFHGEDHTASLAECAYAIETAQALRVPYIRVFGDRCADEDTFARVSQGVRRACALAQGSGVTVLLETHGDFNTADKLSRLLDCAPDLGLLWDVEHTHLAGEDPYVFMDRLLSCIKHVHLKDVRADGSLCLPGEGEIPLRAIADALAARGYGGYLSLEWEKRWHPELATAFEALAQYTALLS